MKTCEACHQEISLPESGYRDMVVDMHMEAPVKRVRLSSRLLQFYFSIKNPILKVLMYPLGFALGVGSMTVAAYLAFPGLYYVGYWVSKLFNWSSLLEDNAFPIAWLAGFGVACFFTGAYFLGDYITHRLSRKLLNER